MFSVGLKEFFRKKKVRPEIRREKMSIQLKIAKYDGDVVFFKLNIMILKLSFGVDRSYLNHRLHFSSSLSLKKIAYFKHR